MILFFDTETTGLPKNWNALVSDLNNWPRLVQIAWILYDYDGNQLSEGDYIIKPNGFTIPENAIAIHRITTERAHAVGVSIEVVLKQFYDLVNNADLIVAHNMNFDEKVIGAEFLRNNFLNIIDARRKICTMNSATDYCKLPGVYGYKWPTLSELYFKLFANSFDESHDAKVDIRATAKCFWQLKQMGIIQFPNKKASESSNETNYNDKPIKSLESNLETKEDNDYKQVLDEYNNKLILVNIQLASKVKAISILAFKFNQMDKNISREDATKYLQWNYNDNFMRTRNIGINSMNYHQKKFIETIKGNIVSEHPDSVIFTSKSTDFEKIEALDLITIISVNNSEQLDLLIKHIYNNYVNIYFNQFIKRATLQDLVEAL